MAINILLSVIVLIVIKLNVCILSVIMLNAIASSVIMPNVVASTAATKKEKKEKVYQRFLDPKSDSHRHLNRQQLIIDI
jgi:hypothetical protein